MSGIRDYETYDALGLAALVAEGEVTPGELLEAALERLEAINPRINAIADLAVDPAKTAVVNRTTRPISAPACSQAPAIMSTAHW